MSSVVMITDGAALNFTGEKIQADGYYGYADGLHTVAFYMTNFDGRIYVEGTLASTPVEVDWFGIYLQATYPYIEYTNKTGVEGYTFQGNFIYLRIRVDRTNLGSPELNAVGTLDKVLLKI